MVSQDVTVVKQGVTGVTGITELTKVTRVRRVMDLSKEGGDTEGKILADGRTNQSKDLKS